MTSKAELLMRPIIGIENRTAQEVFDIMCDRFNSLPDEPAPRGYPFQEPGHIDFDAPSNEDEAAAMAILATNWLEKNAPHRLQSNRLAIVPAPSPTKPEGLEWKLVPIEPTEQMLDAYWKQTGESQEMRSRTHAYMRRYWASMLAVSPVSDADTVRVKREDAEAVIAGISDNPKFPKAIELRERLRASLNGGES